MRLNSRAFLETPIHQAPHIKFEWLEGDAEDLIALTGGPEGPISTRRSMPIGRARGGALRPTGEPVRRPAVYRVAASRHRRRSAAPRPALIDLAYAKGLPLVATNEPYFAAADDYEAHDALLCIAGGRLIAETDRDQLTPDHRFKTRAEMAVLFADMPEALASTVEIAERCAFRPKTRKPILPRFTVGAGTNAADAERRGARNCAVRPRRASATGSRSTASRRARREEDYRARLAFEIDVITRMNYAVIS